MMTNKRHFHERVWERIENRIRRVTNRRIHPQHHRVIRFAWESVWIPVYARVDVQVSDWIVAMVREEGQS